MPPEALDPAPSVLVVDDDEIVRVSLGDRLEMEGFAAVTAAGCAEARARFDAGAFDLVVTDIRLPDGDGRELFEHVCRTRPGVPVILMTAYISVPDAVALIKAGAMDYLTKPFDLDDFVAKARRAIDRARDLRAAPLTGRDGSRAPAGSGILGRSPALRRIEEIAARIRDVDSSVLITGESGVGKEVVADFIHRNSARAGGPFVAVNCAALPLNLIESELFGHERGSFTGAERQRRGRFEMAQGGSILLDEIAEVPPDIQVKLLRVLQERQVERVGGTGAIVLDVRVMAATQVDLEAAIADGRFRADLYWRLNVIRIHVPPLRERPEDVLFLARRFLAEHAARAGRELSGFSAEAEARLLEAEFPGNVRELRNMIERAVAFAAGSRVQERDLFLDGAESDAGEASPLGLRASVEAAERAAIQRALAGTGGIVTAAAESLGISRKSLWEKMRRYGISKSERS